MKKLLFLSGLLVVLGICMVSCGDDDIGGGEVTYYFGGDDLFYEIPAEGGSVSFPPDEYAPLRQPGPFMIINRPLSCFMKRKISRLLAGYYIENRCISSFFHIIRAVFLRKISCCMNWLTAMWCLLANPVTKMLRRYAPGRV